MALAGYSITKRSGAEDHWLHLKARGCPLFGT